MSREYLTDVLNKFAQVTSILVETSKIKEYLDNKCVDDNDLKIILEKTKNEVENLCELSTSVKDLFYKQYKEVFSKLSTVNGTGGDKTTNNANESDENDPLGSDSTPDIINSSQTEKNDAFVKPLIKLVDINKLVEPKALIKKELLPPKAKKTVQIDTSIVIISSDEEIVKEPRSRLSRRKAAIKTRTLLNEASSSDSERDNDKLKQKRIKNGNRRRIGVDDVTLSDASSTTSMLSEDSVARKEKTVKSPNIRDKKKIEEEIPDWQNDPKFKTNCYVKVLRIPCEKLKEHYLEKLELLEVKKLCDINTLKRKRSRKYRLEDSSDSDNVEVKKKKKNKSLENKNDEENESSSCDDEPIINKIKEDSPNHDDLTEQAKQAEAEITMALLQSDKEDSEGSASEDFLASEKETAPEEIPPLSDKGDDGAKVEEDLLALDKENPGNEIPPNSDKEEDFAEKAVNSDKDDDTIPENLCVNENNEKETEKSHTENDSDKEISDGNKNKNSDNEEKTESDKKSDDDDKEESKEKKNEDKSKKKWRKDKLLTMKLSSTDTEEELEKLQKKKDNLQQKLLSDDDEQPIARDKKKRRVKKRLKKAILSDSDSDKNNDSGDNYQKPSDSSSSSESEKENEIEEQKKPARKRVKRVKDSSEDDEEKSTRKQIRNIWGKDSLAETTKQAEAEENERKARIAERQRKYNQIFDNCFERNANVEKIVLDFDEKNNKELLKVSDVLVSKLKPHQASGVQFMWDACFESLERTKTTKGSGCILAHCMGLGKTLQVIALAHTLLVNSEETGVKKVMVVSPLNTVLNWVNEFRQWLPDLEEFEVYELVSFKQNYERQEQVRTWHQYGGVLIIGYDMFRNLSNPENKRLSKRMRSIFREGLVDPGPDLVICDEGHLLKNEKTSTSIAMNRLKTMRRIVLTGTPLQNNLKEYFCMVQFIKPNLLGTYKEYLNRFVNPITNGQYTDSTPHDIQVMRRRSHVLHKMLDGVVQRRDYSVLQPYLPPKYEYVLFLTLTETQIQLYSHYMEHFARRSSDGSNRTAFLFVDFQALQRICTHPRVLLDKSIELKMAKDKEGDSDESEGSLKDFINDDDDEDTTSSSDDTNSDDSAKKKSTNTRKRITRATAALVQDNDDEDSIVDLSNEQKEWWQQYCDGDELNVIAHSSKLFMLFEILKVCEQIEDKVLVFSQSLYSLNVIEYFLARIHDATQADDTASVGGYSGSWCLGLDYFRLDGSSSCDNRNLWCKQFNDPSNSRARLFLISTRAGGLGINLVAANRVVIFDVSWNPSHDIQSIYRVYRFGQTKPCYIYRFVTYGTMEMKIYERQVTKQAISKRVIDEQQIDRHYNQNDLAELYKFDPKPEGRPIPLVPKDVLLGEMLQKFEDRIYKYHEHQSLLENKEDECLNEEERKAAWEEFENEKKTRNNAGINNLLASQPITIGLMSLIKKENPALTDAQIRAIFPGLYFQLQEQTTRGDLTLLRKAQQEYTLLQQALQNQRFKEQLLQSQAFRLHQQQQQQNRARGTTFHDQYLNQIPGTSANSTEIIDLND